MKTWSVVRTLGLLLPLVAATAGCSANLAGLMAPALLKAGHGSVKVSFKGLGGYKTAATTADIDHVDITLSDGGDQEDRSLSAAQLVTAPTVTFNAVPVGVAELVVVAYGRDGSPIGRGAASTRVLAGQSKNVPMTVKLVGDTGSVSATVTFVDGNPTPNATDLTGDWALGDGTAPESLPTCYYGRVLHLEESGTDLTGTLTSRVGMGMMAIAPIPVIGTFVDGHLHLQTGSTPLMAPCHGVVCSDLARLVGPSDTTYYDLDFDATRGILTGFSSLPYEALQPKQAIWAMPMTPDQPPCVAELPDTAAIPAAIATTD